MQQGFFSIQQTCPACLGAGTVITDPCRACQGKGRVQEQKTLSVKVPAGVDSGNRIRLSGEGELGERDAPPGDLYVQVRVKEHPLFQRDGNDLYSEVPISVITAALGGDFEVPTLTGRVSLKVPAGTQTGKLFRIRGKGVRSVRSHSEGDLLCRVVVETPVHLTDRQKDLLRAFAESLQGSDAAHTPNHKSWLDKAKKFFDDLTT